MSNWQTYQLAEKITAILAEVPDYAQGHHLGRPFLTAYQIAIALAHRYPDVVASLGYPIGGAGTGQHNSLAQYIAQRLSAEIKAGHLPDVEGGFLSNQYLDDIVIGHRFVHFEFRASHWDATAADRDGRFSFRSLYQ
jgi:hypothetical protein